MKPVNADLLRTVVRNQFYSRPFFYFAISLIAGILWGEEIKTSPALPGGLAVSALVAGLGTFFRGKKREGLAWALLVVFFCLGWMRIRREKTFPPDHIANIITHKPVVVEGVLAKPVEQFPGRTRLYLHAENVFLPGFGEGLQKEGKNVSGLIRLESRFRIPMLKYGDRIRVKTRLNRPRVYRNPGGFDYRSYLQRKGIFLLGKIRSEKDITLLDSSPSLMRELFDFRKRLSQFIGHDTAEKQLLITVLLGMREVMPYGLRKSFIRTGTAHLLAISGLHVGILATFFFIFFRELWRLLPLRMYLQLSRKIRLGKLAAIFSITPLVGYTFLVGAGIPTVRALIMILTYLAALVLERDRDYFNVLALAAVIILLWRPASLGDVGFQLSFVTVFFIIYIAAIPVIRRDTLLDEPGRMGKIALKAGSFCLISLSAYLASLPLVSYHFQRISLIGFGANLVAVFLFSLILPVGIIGLITFPVSRSLSAFFITVCLKGLSLLVEWVKGLGSIEWASIPVYQPTLLMLLAVYAFYLCLGRAHRYRSARFGAAALLLSGFLLIIQQGKSKLLQVNFLDVGQGDATFIRTPGGKTILIDAGGSSSSLFNVGKNVIAPFLLHEWVGRLDLVILSHHHPDHFGGLPYIMNNFQIGEFWDTAGDHRFSSSYEKVRKTIDKKEVPIRYITAGSSFHLETDLKLEVLYPPAELHGNSSYGADDRSIVLRLVYRNISFLFPGDIRAKGEGGLIDSGAKLTATVLKIPRHGSAASSTLAFLQAVRPDYAVLFRSSYPRSNYTARRVLNRYRNLGIPLLKTRREGCITFYSDGDVIRLETASGTKVSQFY